MENNKTRASLRKALTELDGYYRNIADGATEISKKNRVLEKKHNEIMEELNQAKSQIEKLSQTVASLKQEIKVLETDNKALKGVVNDYIYPDIANELLAKDGVLSNVETSIVADKLEEKLISADTKISKKPDVRSGSTVIQGIFNKFED